MKHSTVRMHSETFQPEQTTYGRKEGRPATRHAKRQHRGALYSLERHASRETTEPTAVRWRTGEEGMQILTTPVDSGGGNYIAAGSRRARSVVS